jgi:hypothetical protein
MQSEQSSNSKVSPAGSVRPADFAHSIDSMRAASPLPQSDSLPLRNQEPAFTYWRVEGSLLEISTLRTVGFFNWNSQSFLERWLRRAGMLVVLALRPF